jgi:peptidoglycan/LPS O-acetylase OafA/YrhL
VVTYHSFSLPWLSWVFPAMGMMFALAGGLMVRSLDRQPAKTVVKNRFRRLLPALWLFGAVWVTYMTIKGGSPTNWTDPTTDSKMPVWHLVYWVVPVFQPPGNQAGFDGTEVLWYLRTYLWLVALSPFLLKAFRKWPVPTLLAPLLIVVLQSFNIIPNENSGNLFGIGEVWALLSTLGTFAPCWMLGFAHRTGKLNKLSGPAVAGISVAMAAVGAIWALTHDADGYDLNGIPLAQALWSMAFILPLLRYAPDASWIGRTPFLGRFVALVNARAVTIYLWHNVLIDLSYPIEDKIAAAVPALSSAVYNPAATYIIIWVLIAGAVVLFGWAEDVAARRSPRIFPVGPSAAERRAADAAAQEKELAEAPTMHSADQFPPFARGNATQPLPTQAAAPDYPQPAYASGYGGGEGYDNRFYAQPRSYDDRQHSDQRYSDPRHSDPRHSDPRQSDRQHGDPRHGDQQHSDRQHGGQAPQPRHGAEPGVYGSQGGRHHAPGAPREPYPQQRRGDEPPQNPPTGRARV